jgi:predicted small metal-binding protein
MREKRNLGGVKIRKHPKKRGEYIMGLKLACKDLGTACPFVARGQTMDELMVEAGQHAKTVHGYTDEQLNAPEMKKKIKAAIKKE